MITMGEMKTYLDKTFTEDEITSADLKCAMMAFDTDRNGRIDLNEWNKQFQNKLCEEPLNIVVKKN